MRLVVLILVPELRICLVPIPALIDRFVCIAEPIQTNGSLPAIGFYRHTDRVYGIALCLHLLTELLPIHTVLETVLHVLFQLLPVRRLSTLFPPMRAFGRTAVKLRVLQNRQTVFLADRVRDLPQIVMLGYLIPELLSILERNGIHHKMIVQIVCIQVCGDKDLIVLAPHPFRRFDPDRMTLLGCQLIRLERLIPMIRNNLAALAVFLLDRHHLFVGKCRGTIHAGNVFLFIGLVIVLRISERLIKIFVEIFLCRRLVRIVGIIQYLLELAPDGPESCGCHVFTSFRTACAWASVPAAVVSVLPSRQVNSPYRSECSSCPSARQAQPH